MYFFIRHTFRGPNHIIFSTLRSKLETIHNTTTDSQIQQNTAKTFIAKNIDKIEPYNK